MTCWKKQNYGHIRGFQLGWGEDEQAEDRGFLGCCEHKTALKKIKFIKEKDN